MIRSRNTRYRAADNISGDNDDEEGRGTDESDEGERDVSALGSATAESGEEFARQSTKRQRKGPKSPRNTKLRVIDSAIEDVVEQRRMILANSNYPRTEERNIRVSTQCAYNGVYDSMWMFLRRLGW